MVSHVVSHKNVLLMEQNVLEAHRNNVLGTGEEVSCLGTRRRRRSWTWRVN